MFLRLLFGPEGHQELRRLRASGEGERKGREKLSPKGTEGASANSTPSLNPLAR
jgi:hypothetical protein